MQRGECVGGAELLSCQKCKTLSILKQDERVYADGCMAKRQLSLECGKSGY